MGNHLPCAVRKSYNLILRLGGPKSEEVLKSPFARLFDITAKPMKGWMMPEENGFNTDKRLKDWLALAKAFVKKLPAK